MSFCPLWFAGHKSTSAELFGRKGTDGRPDPGKPKLPGAASTRIHPGKPRLQGAADPDKSSILYHAFRYGLGYVKPRFISRLPCSLFSKPKDYLLGPDLVVVAAAKK